MTIKVTFSLSPELDAALDCAAAATQMSKSRTVEVYLREHPQIKRYIKLVRAEPDIPVYVASPHKRVRGRRAVNAKTSSSR